tara:strand:+ start:1318 stop:1554 length:237 start_codon:yes stop_codon:yes gene_type:complete
MAKKKNEVNKNEITLNYEGEEYNFEFDSLSEEAKANYRRANELAVNMMKQEQAVSEQRWLLNKYVTFVVEELDSKDKK